MGIPRLSPKRVADWVKQTDLLVICGVHEKNRKNFLVRVCILTDHVILGAWHPLIFHHLS